MNWLEKHLNTIYSICIWIAFLSVVLNAVMFPEARFAWITALCWIFIAKVNSNTINYFETTLEKCLEDNLKLYKEVLTLRKEKTELIVKGKDDE